MQAIERYLVETADKGKNTADSVKALVKFNDKYLIVRRAYGLPGQGCWDLPGGQVKSDETPEKAVEREVMEETSLFIKNVKASSTVEVAPPHCTKTYNTAFFTCDAKDDGVYLRTSPTNRDAFAYWKSPKPEHCEFKWVKYKTDMKELPMLPELKEILMKKLK